MAALPPLVRAEEPAGADERYADPEYREYVTDFVLGNMLWTFFHELGHALIHEYEIPVLGREEDAADQLATLMLLGLRKSDPDANTRYIVYVAVGTLTSWDESGAYLADEVPSWDGHSLDIQRFYNIICLMYGSDAAEFDILVDASRMPRERAESCADDYATARRTWDRVLRPYILPTDGTRPTGQDGRLVLHFYPSALDERVQLRRDVISKGLLSDAVSRINMVHGFARDVPVDYQDCGVDNAFWDDGSRRIVMCYELMDTFARWAEARE